ncbi:unnamed protein product [Protopolystoma xenopodis]|uniref:Uncharacterized protein n=1 Tax=Protopolystoma xenopodis TaxID=117903 RepID=A0A448WE60_9PLAT|nr:unnamed protein product [Protopolystoma xenopodis]
MQWCLLVGLQKHSLENWSLCDCLCPHSLLQSPFAPPPGCAAIPILDGITLQINMFVSRLHASIMSPGFRCLFFSSFDAPYPSLFPSFAFVDLPTSEGTARQLISSSHSDVENGFFLQGD